MWDTMLASYVLDSSRRGHGLDALAGSLLGCETTSYEEVAGKGAKQICFSKVDVDVATKYAAEDADITLCLYEYFNKELTKYEKIKNVLQQIELPLLPILAQMELDGVMIDAALLHQQSRNLYKSMITLQGKIFELSGEEFNISSPKQLQEILYEKLDLPVLKKTPKGKPSTAEPVLQRLANDYELPELILNYRSLSKLKSTYTDRLPEQIDSETDRVHTSYRQTGTVTGRLSSSDPNLQNIPIRSSEGRKVRQAFVAPRGYRILAADYSQIELRLMAHFSQDHVLLRAFDDDIDIHRATAAEIFSVNLDDVSSEMRRQAKAINFGLMYGMSAFGLSQQLNIPRKQAAEFIETYFMRYPKVQAFMEKTRQLSASQGYVETLSGRRVMIPGAQSKAAMQRAAAERAAINAPLQGTSADIIKQAMIALKEDVGFCQLRAKMVMQVHDELVFEVHKDDCVIAQKHIVQAMEHAVKLAVPLQVAVGIGLNWDEAH
jgi:DNA polymerase-1